MDLKEALELKVGDHFKVTDGTVFTISAIYELTASFATYQKATVLRYHPFGQIPTQYNTEYLTERQLYGIKQVKVVRYQAYEKVNGELVFSNRKLKLKKVEGLFADHIK